MWPQQKFVICTPAWIPTDDIRLNKRTRELRADTVGEYIDIMLYDTRIIGALHFLYPTFEKGPGAQDLPLTLNEIKEFWGRD
jgi:hypothetical protein